MKLSKKTVSIILVAILICIVAIYCIFSLSYSELIKSFRYENLRGLATALAVYRNDNNDMLPDFNQWCDKIIAEVDCSPKMFMGIIDSQEGVCGYALNRNLEGIKFSELSDKVVFIFEAKGPWNLSGGPELTKQSKHKDIAVIFVDGFVDFVKKEDVDTLKWKP